MIRRWCLRALRPTPITAAVVVVSAVVLWWSIDEGLRQQRKNSEIKLGAAPLVGRDSSNGWDWRINWALPFLIIGVAVLAWSVWRQHWTRWSTRRVLGTAGLGALAFGVLLALVDGASGLTYGADHPTEYLANLQQLPPAGEFVRTFVDRIDGYSVHCLLYTSPSPRD